MGKRKKDVIGEQHISSKGQLMTIIKCQTLKDITVEFEDGTIVEHKTYFDFLRGKIRNPNFYSSIRVGEKTIVNGEIATIVEYIDAFNCSIQFEDGTIIKNVTYGNFKKNNLSNPNKPTVCGVGYLGQGEFWSKKNGHQSSVYIMWQGMIERCYDGETIKKRPNYKGCIVSEEFKNFQNFAKFYFENKWGNGLNLVPDKDLLCHNKDKIYSKETICFVPIQINNLFLKRENDRGKYLIGVSKRGKNKFVARLSKNSTRITLGVFDTELEAFYCYKEEKEKYIKEVADFYKNTYPDFPEKIYRAMYEYEVNIND